MEMDTGLYLAAIERHCNELAAVAEGRLDARVEHCPGWDVAELLRHLIEVHWFWSTIAGERLTEPPEEARRPAPPSDEDLVAAFRAGAAHLVEVLGASDQSAACWTWAPLQHDIAFVTRHQVQEAAVHHFDAAHAVGQEIEIDPAVAADSIEEFLTFSVSSEADPAEPAREALGGSFDLSCSDTGDVFHVTDGETPGTVRFSRDKESRAPAVTASASLLLLFLYGRVELDTSALEAGLLERFRALCFTD